MRIVRVTASFLRHFVRAPRWVVAWVTLIALTNCAAVFFVGHDPRAKWVLFALAVSAVVMIWLFARFGYSRIMGLGHLVSWGPLVVFLWATRSSLPDATAANVLMWLVMGLNSAAMAIDVIDLARFLSGDRAPMVSIHAGAPRDPN